MKSIIALLPILGMALAAPVASEADSVALQERQVFNVGLIFYGADPDAKYELTVPADGSEFKIVHPELSVSKIYLSGGATCFISGSEGSTTFVRIGDQNFVGPPQPQVSGRCYRL